MFARLFVFASVITLVGCTEPSFAPVLPTPEEAVTETVLVATNRARGSDGWFTAERGGATAYLSVPVSFPAAYEPGAFAPIRKTPDPATDYSVAAQEPLTRADFQTAITRQGDATLFVHGYFNAFFNGVFQSAQLARAFDLPGAMVHFAWPSAGSNTAYAYDRDSLLASRDAMEAVIRDMARAPGEVTLIAHSLGSMLIMEALRQIEIAEPGWTHRNIDAIAFVAPDIDIEVFRSQAARLTRLPETFVIYTSDHDPVLGFSARLAGTKHRLGNSEGVAIEGSEITMVEIGVLSRESRTGHFIPATSPTAIRILSESEAFTAFFPRKNVGQTEDGLRLIRFIRG